MYRYVDLCNALKATESGSATSLLYMFVYIVAFVYDFISTEFAFDTFTIMEMCVFEKVITMVSSRFLNK